MYVSTDIYDLTSNTYILIISPVFRSPDLSFCVQHAH